MLFFGDMNGMLFGIDTRTQDVLPGWPQPGLDLANLTLAGLTPSSQAQRMMWPPQYRDGLLYVPTHRGLFVVDAATAEIVWKVSAYNSRVARSLSEM